MRGRDIVGFKGMLLKGILGYLWFVILGLFLFYF